MIATVAKAAQRKCPSRRVLPAAYAGGVARRPNPSQRLKAYQAKRNFARTPEPSGQAKPAKSVRTGPAKGAGRRAGQAKALFFCVQKHLASHLHYDFRLEHAGVLLSWAVPKGPSLNPADRRLAMQTEDHPLDYGQFEGVIPEGYGAGIVMLWDRGTWRPEPGFEDIDAALEKGELKFTLDGVKLKGSWVLVRTAGSRWGGRDGRSWLLIKHRDDWAGQIDVTEAAPLSVKTFGDFADILAAENPKIWASHRPAEGGATGAMFREVIEKATAIKLHREAEQKPARPKARKRTTIRKK